MATSAQGASILTRKTKHRHEKVIKIYNAAFRGEEWVHRSPQYSRQRNTRGAESKTEQKIVGIHKGRLPKSLGQNLKREIFQVWVSEEVRRLPEGI